jgi:hypothetical protein
MPSTELMIKLEEDMCEGITIEEILNMITEVILNLCGNKKIDIKPMTFVHARQGLYH